MIRIPNDTDDFKSVCDITQDRRRDHEKDLRHLNIYPVPPPCPPISAMRWRVDRHLLVSRVEVFHAPRR